MGAPPAQASRAGSRFESRPEKLTCGTVLTVTRCGTSPVRATNDLINSPKVLGWGKNMSETELVERLEKLERDNRRLKRLGTAALVLAAALGLTAAARPVPDVIKAHAFEVVDSAGKLRIRMAVTQLSAYSQFGVYGVHIPLGAHVTFYDAAGMRRELLSVPDDGGSSIFLLDSHGASAVTISHNDNDTDLPGISKSELTENQILLARPTVQPSKFYEGIDMSVSGAGEPTVTLFGPQNLGSFPGTIAMALSGEGEPGISLTDSKGFEMDMGSTATQTIATGATQQTSADSIVMFGNDKKHHVIWQAP